MRLFELGTGGVVRALSGLFTAAILTSCGSPGTAGDGAAPDAGVEASAGSAAAAHRLLERAAALASGDAQLATRLEPVAAAGFTHEGGEFVSAAFRAARTQPGFAVAGRFPERADSPIRAAIGGGDDYALTLQPVGMRGSRGLLDEGRLAYADVAESTDMVAVSSEAGVEWMYLLRDEHARHELTFDVTLGHGLAEMKLDNSGALVVADAAGQGMLRIARPYARDAHGERRDAGMEYRDGQLRIVLDTAGMTFPVVLDPAIETAAWELRTSPPSSRYGQAMAYDPNRKQTVLFGGRSGNADMGDTWVFDGTTWTLRSTVGPAPRRLATAVYDPWALGVMMFGGNVAGTDVDETWRWDGATWTQTCTGGCVRPPARESHGMVYDSGRSRVVLFGGFGPSGYRNDTWEYDGTKWTNPSNTGPTGRRAFAFAYDAARAQTVLFGGQSAANTYEGDTWVWNGTSWTQKTPLTSPTARNDAAAAFHLDTNLVVLYGGATSIVYSNETWTWNGTTWTQKNPATDPNFRNGHRLVYANDLHRVLSFGGEYASSGGDTWLWDGVDWAEPIHVPGPRFQTSLAYDSARNRTVLFGGWTKNDTWEWDGFSWNKQCTAASPCSTAPPGYAVQLAYDSTRGRTVAFGGQAAATFEWSGTDWANKSPGGSPSSRERYAMAFDSANNRTLLFGGKFYSSSTLYSDLWAWNGTAWTQLCTLAACLATAPTPRQGSAAAFDSARNVLVVFGGFDGTSQLGELWEWTGAAWSQRCTAPPCSTAPRPSARMSSAMAFDSTRGRVVIQGGSGASGALGDTWEWDGTSFVQTDAGGATSPAPRFAHAAAYDKARRRTLVYAGQDSSATFGDLWEYHVVGNSCAVGISCATGNCVDGVCCESAVCGTCEACNTAGNPGVCAAVTNVDDLDTCTGNNTCDAFGACKKRQGQSCAAATECATGACSDGYCCNAACSGGCDECASTPGTCSLRGAGYAGSNPVCGGFACNGASGACPTTCAADTDCASTHYCAADGTCQPRRAQGAGCNAGAGADCKVSGCRECSSGACVDFVCCASTSCATCQTCAGATPGTCTTVVNADDPDSCSPSSSNTCNATGQCKKKLAQACAANADCASGFCADGVCCNGACTGGCDVCKVSLGAAADGQCTLLTAGATGAGCGNYACTGASGACPGSCSSDSACVASAYCRTGDGTCQPDQANGGACTTGAQCVNGNCVDGFCCNVACAGLCQACSAGKTGGANGTCASVTTGTDPDGECVQDPSSTCQRDGFCNGAGACRLYTSGTSCGSPTCTGGVANSSTCNGSGTCSTTPTVCSPYACGGAACATSCTTDANCATGYFCATGGTCKAKQLGGAGCGAANQCASGNCVDGVCCDTACNQACQACTAAKKGSGSDGTCGYVKVDSDPDGECASDGTTCGLTGNCNGTGACKVAPSGTVCGTTSCAGTIQTGQQCDGAGNCGSGSSTSCATGFVCKDASVCATSCTDDTVCAAGYYCDSTTSKCVTAQATGSACGRTRQCSSGNCVDGFCCDGVCSGKCQACANAKTGQPNGQCKAVSAATDPDDECAATASNTCGTNGMCDGVGACRFWPSGTVCGTTTCAAGVQSGNQCNGTGACVSGSSNPCTTGYACLDASVCATSCTDDTQCAGGYYCSAGACVAAQASGGACNRARQCATGNCIDGFCCDSACAGACQACSKAKNGLVDGQCKPVAPDTDPDNECTAMAQSSCQENGNCDGAGACKKWPFGTTCGSATCANAVQTGQVCDGTGTCVSGQSTPCGAGYVCATLTACATTCTDDSQCAATYYCHVGTCQPRQAVGAACTTSSQCALGNCVDGFCCDGACAGTCQACSLAKKGAGLDGKCGAIKVGADPDNECATKSAATCDTTGSCDGAGACQKYPAGTTCGATTCTPGTPVDTQAGASCDGFGTCQTSAQTSCGLYKCSGSACATGCLSHSDCQPSAFCDTNAHTCQPDKANGITCGTAAECSSGNCVDGVCCAQACAGACQACSAALKGFGQDGVCEPIAKGLDPQAECNDQGPSSCGTNGSCNGFGACDLYAAGTACGTTTCVPDAVTGGKQTGSTCNGSGSCVPATSSTCGPYVCQGSSCGTACVTSADCIASYYCDTGGGIGQCKPDQANAATCASADQCTSGHCVDGVCCDSPCGGTCQACVGSKTGALDGTCASVTAGTDPDSDCADQGAGSCGTSGLCSGSNSCAFYAAGTACGVTTCTSGQQTGSACNGQGACAAGQTTACGLYQCRGSACGADCAIDDDCVTSAYCDTTGNKCKADQTNGSACDRAAQCQSGNCVDGVCCDQACGGACQACSAERKGQGADGNCGPVAAGTDPDNECAATAPSGCADDGTCDGAGACRKYLPGTACGTTTCTSSTLVGEQCDGFGACKAAQTTQCDPYLCTGQSSCPTSCAANEQCVAGYFCAPDGTCKAKSNDGAACTSASECKSGFCAEGLCCNSACDGTCQSCSGANNVSGKDGVCGDAKAGTDPQNDCAASPVTDCDFDGTCDGNGSCRLYPAGTACGATACNGNAQTGYACDGTGTCDANAKLDCALYACKGGACATACAADGDCSASGYCDVATSTCLARHPNGEACTSADACLSGFCVDGVCCNEVCAGQCQACDVGTAKGTCSPVVGLPHGARPKCPAAPGSSPDELCKARTCDGQKDVNQCVGYVGSDVGCRDQKCDKGTETFSAACDGHGACGDAVGDGGVKVKKCAPFTCADAKVCVDSCTTSAECIEGYRCDVPSGQCVGSTTCDGDHTLTDPKGATSDCSPFRCTAAGACVDRCASVDDCVTGYVCNADRLCVEPNSDASAQDQGSCGCRTVGGGGGPGRAAVILLLGVAATVTRRRRRAA